MGRALPEKFHFKTLMKLALPEMFYWCLVSVMTVKRRQAFVSSAKQSAEDAKTAVFSHAAKSCWAILHPHVAAIPKKQLRALLEYIEMEMHLLHLYTINTNKKKIKYILLFIMHMMLIILLVGILKWNSMNSILMSDNRDAWNTMYRMQFIEWK